MSRQRRLRRAMEQNPKPPVQTTEQVVKATKLLDLLKELEPTKDGATALLVPVVAAFLYDKTKDAEGALEEFFWRVALLCDQKDTPS